MAQPARIFRVFVSSTFSDMVAERNALQARVFPELRTLCAEHGARFQAIDLRWGISAEAGLNQRATDLCLREIARCQRVTKRPNFILLMGDRYGWQPAPDDIPATEFDILVQRMSPSDQEFIGQWYWRDDNAEPSLYVLQPRRGVYVDQNCWNEVEKRIRSMLLAALLGLNWTPEQLIKYRTSVTEQEIMAGIFGITHADRSTFCFFRTITGLPDTPTWFRDNDPEAQRQLVDLKRRLQEHLPHNIYHYQAKWTGDGITSDHLEQLCHDVKETLSQTILSEVATFETIPPLEVERQAHQTFMVERTRHFVGRVTALTAVKQYLIRPTEVTASKSSLINRLFGKSDEPVHADANPPLVLYGRSGVGKSTVMARNIQQMQEQVLYRFIGITPDASDIRTLLISLCEEIQEHYGATDPVPQDYEKLIYIFPKCLAQATAEKPLIIFLDALDQLSTSNYPSNLRWLPRALPSHVKLVLSAIPGPVLDALQRRLPAEQFVEILPLPTSDAEQLLTMLLNDAGRTLQPAQHAEVLTKFEQNGLPLYLRLAFEEAKLWRSYRTEFELKPDIPSLLRDNLFARLSDKAEHGEMLVSRSLAYLSAARNGLSEDEMLDVLTQDAEFWTAFEATTHATQREALSILKRLPIAVWSRLYFDLEPYLIERGADNALLLAFYHRQFSEMVDTLYLAPAQQDRHAHLAHYFEQQDLYIGGRPNARKVSEQAFQQAKSDLHEAYGATLASYPFLQASLEVRSVQALIEDCGLKEDSTIRLIQSALSMSAYILSQDKTALAHQLVGRLMLHHKNIPQIRRLTDEIVATVPGIYPTHLESDYVSHNQAGGALLRIITRSLGSMIYSYDGQRIRLVTIRKTEDASVVVVQVWDADNGTLLFTREGYAKNCEYIRFSPDERRIVSVSYSATQVWDTDTGALLLTLKGHTDGVNSAAFSPDGQHIVSTSRDKTVRVWDANTGRLLLTLKGHTDGVNNAAFSPDGQHIVSTSDDKMVCVWDTNTGALLHTLNGHTKPIQYAIFSPDGQRIIVVLAREIRIWEAKSGVLLHTLENINARAFRRDRRRIVSIFSDTKIDDGMQIWDTDTGTLLLTLKGHTDRVTSVEFSSDGQRIVSVSNDKTMRVWDAESGVLLHTLECGHLGSVGSVEFSPDGQRILTSGDLVLVWDAEGGTAGGSLAAPTRIGHTDRVTSVAFSSDGRRILSTSGDKTWRMWDTETGAPLLPFSQFISSISKGKIPPPPSNDKITSAAFSPDGQYIVLALEDKTVKVWNAELGLPQLASDRALLNDFKERHTGEVTSVAYSPDGRRIVSASKDKTIRVWDADTNARQLILKGHTDRVNSARFSPDGQRILSASGAIGQFEINFHNKLSDNTVRVWDAKRGRLLLTLKGHTDGVNSVAFSPDGRRILSASGRSDNTIRVWDAYTGKCLGVFADTLEGHIDLIRSFPDIGAVAVCHFATNLHSQTLSWHDNQLRLLDRDGMVRTAFYGDAPFECCAWSPDGRAVAAGDDVGHMVILCWVDGKRL